MSEVTIVRFDGDNLQAVREGQQVWVVVKRVCEALGVSDQGQAAKLKEKPWATTKLVFAVAEDGRNRELFCLNLDALPLWLGGIDHNKVADPVKREKLIAYQKECAKVLADHFFGPRGAEPGGDFVTRQELSAFGTELLTRVIEHMDKRDEKLLAYLDVREANLENRLIARINESGMISVSDFHRIQSDVQMIATLDVVTGRHKTKRAAIADLYREMGRGVDWGGKGQCWNRLPSQLVQPALAILAGRRKDAQRAAKNTRQLTLIHSG